VANKDSSPATEQRQMSPHQLAYLAGPMRGYDEYNFPAFHAAAAKLRGHGLDVWSPAEHDVNEDGFDPAKDTAQPMKHYMRRDLPAVLSADMVCVLPGWEKSQGACLEVHVARTCGIPVYWADTMQPVAVSETAALERELRTMVERLETHTLHRLICNADQSKTIGGDMCICVPPSLRAAPSARAPSMHKIRLWADRHDLSGNDTDIRAAFDDARTL
jgi:nucleoside 2-deoxyribosyltransferase